MEPDDRAARQGANLARHLNQTYPDVVLFLARHAAGRPDASTAELQPVIGAELLLSVTTVAGAVQLLRLPLPAAPGPDTDVRARVRELLRVTRLRVPDAPLTSLEEQIAGNDPQQHRPR